MIRSLSFPTLICVFLPLFAFCQTKNLGSWNVINTRLSLTKNWSVFNELQLRSQSFYNDHFYYEVKGGVSYNINKNFSVLAGTGKYITYDAEQEGNFQKPITANETRLWQQLTMNHYLEQIKFEHRYRAEQRWFTTGYRNRFRYRISTALPVNKSKIEPGAFFLTTFNEIFLTNKAPYFERNRFFIGLGYELNELLIVQPGYVYQYDYKKDNTGSGKHFFQFTLMIDLDDMEDDIQRLPSTVD
ncbi:MAG: DUF2490 domain-containing protein [Chitinophagaceae bacterium]|nr:DUF2490 domain-containing protein [Chitinophagaceae bacterium]